MQGNPGNYAPLASRLGIYTMKFELEDIALKQLDPDTYYDLVSQVKIKKQQREKISTRSSTKSRKVSTSLRSIRYYRTLKHFYSIYENEISKQAA
jgi:GTP pyrophosphokinase